jgi:hypothetical protein
MMLMSEHKIAGVSCILSVALRNGASARMIHSQLESALEGTYGPRSGWTKNEIDVTFVIKSYGGSRLLFTMQQEDTYPSRTTVYCWKKIKELVVFTGQPDDPEMDTNLDTFLCEDGHRPPPNLGVGQALLLDGVALEEVGRYDLQRNCILGFCREHSGGIEERVVGTTFMIKSRQMPAQLFGHCLGKL